MKDDSTVSFPVRMPGSLAQQIKETCNHTDLSQQDVIRLAIRIGLEDLRRANYNIPAAVVDAAEKASEKIKAHTASKGPIAPTADLSSNITPLPAQHIARAAEPQAPYKIGKRSK